MNMISGLEDNQPISFAEHADAGFTVDDIASLLEPEVDLSAVVRDRLRRAQQIRSVAATLPAPAQISLQRRACEVEFEAFLLQKATERSVLRAEDVVEDTRIVSPA